MGGITVFLKLVDEVPQALQGFRKFIAENEFISYLTKKASDFSRVLEGAFNNISHFMLVAIKSLGDAYSGKSAEDLARWLEDLARWPARGRFGANSELSKATGSAIEEMSAAITAEIDSSRQVLIVLLLISIGLIALLFVPLVKRAITKRKSTVFISFQHLRESFAETVDASLNKNSFKVSRVPYEPLARHQDIVTTIGCAIRKTDAVVCIPGSTDTFVDSEIFLAQGVYKPIIFLLGRKGTLPNTADKRYPVFHLEALQNAKFQPLNTFLHYVTKDLYSLWQQYLNAIRSPFLNVSKSFVIAASISIICAFIGFSYLRALGVSERFATVGLEVATYRQYIVMARVLLLIIPASISFISFGYTLLICFGIWKQYSALRKASLRIGTAQFSRGDWVKVIPNLTPGTELYECLYESAPLAHHECP